MANILKVVSLWTGFIGAPGYTTLYFASPSPPPLAAVRAWFQGMSGVLPTVVTIQVQGVGDVVDDGTGVITGSWSAPAPAAVVGAVGGVYAAPSGLVCNLTTATIVNGRRVRGRSFIVPIAGSANQADGSLAPGTVTSMGTTNATFLAATAGQLIVWHRPVDGAGGESAPVTNIVTPDKACVLRSRRD